jgi:hypothetical protein
MEEEILLEQCRHAPIFNTGSGIVFYFCGNDISPREKLIFVPPKIFRRVSGGAKVRITVELVWNRN